MSRLTYLFLLIIPLLISFRWGFYGHKKINELAVFTLPSEMIVFHKNNIKFLSENAVNADKRRYIDSLEAPRHYLDVELYEKNIDSIPQRYTDALLKYGESNLKVKGIVPWQIEKTYRRLVQAYIDKDSLKILKLSADLGHYISDAHVPLHTTANHNGQLTNQHGLHAFWESRLPELFASNYNFVVGKAVYIQDPLKQAWQIVKQAHLHVEDVLNYEKELSLIFPSDKRFSFSERNKIVLRQYSKEYSKAYHDKLDKMVENQMRSSILLTGAFWYSAWVDAGQPNLKNFKKKSVNKNEISDEDIEKSFQKGKLIGRDL